MASWGWSSAFAQLVPGRSIAVAASGAYEGEPAMPDVSSIAAAHGGYVGGDRSAQARS
jgi:hypothetical protein